jgi:hypothetical protein
MVSAEAVAVTGAGAWLTVVAAGICAQAVLASRSEATDDVRIRMMLSRLLCVESYLAQRSMQGLSGALATFKV